ncbi:hypothetical protein Pcinc_002205 [Petrolisthes cinctipes]|uniref:SSD domain-containing protein n=1 Tax=Petrolisthes cinctipes TaxID=88211 RepID=A0AAE1GQJ7_PETCI|nr:hypothetical protein Pcinc_002205 [Petrolisthes cinctipes]
MVKMGNFLGRVSARLLSLMELGFYHYGRIIAKVPAFFIVLCFVVTGLCSLGLTKFTEETNPFKLWTPEGSEFLQSQEWQQTNFPSDVRFSMGIYEADNVLNKSVIMEMLRVHQVVVNTTTANATWPSLCARIPAIRFAFIGRKKRETRKRQPRQAGSSIDGQLDWSKLLPREDYCQFLNSLEEVCMENSLLEVFDYDEEYITSLTQEEILQEVNEVENSAVTGLPLNVSQFLADIKRDNAGNIIGASAATHSWFTRINKLAKNSDDFMDDAGTGTRVDVTTFHWEQKMIQNLLNDTERPPDVQFYLMAASSFGTVSGDSIRGDVQYLSLGFGVVFVYVVVMLGRCNAVESRPLLSLLGLSCVGLAIVLSYGLCSAFGVLYGPVNSILPFLLLGLGIDDMFVIMEAWRGLKTNEQHLELSERVGLTLGRAGVAITVTSLTDFLAFAVGSTTTLPALRSFCLYCAVGVAAVYFFQATFFVAWLSIDQRRIEDSRHSVIWCWKISGWTPNTCSQQDLCYSFFSQIYARVLLLPLVRVIVLVVTALLFGVSVWGMTELRQEFDPVWFLPQDSYLFRYFEKQREYYPSSGEKGLVYLGNVSLVEELPRLQRLTKDLLAIEDVAEVENWADAFTSYWGDEYDPDQFSDQLSRFLFSTVGAKYRSRNFRFSSELNCSDPAPPVTASSVEFQYHVMESSQEEVKAMEDVRAAVGAINFSGEALVWARAYGSWETNKVIEEELWRNLGVALAVVAAATLVLLASVTAAAMVVACVLLTLIDVAALMAWWDLTIDTVSCIDLVLAVGLCVDYAAHVAHTFLTHTGSRSDRAAATVSTIGPPVLSGGFSTFLAFVFLAGSTSHVFISFFKIFFGVSLFGLYHGLVFLPVLLSLIGPDSHATTLSQPPPHKSHTNTKNNDKLNNNENNNSTHPPQQKTAMMTNDSGSNGVERGQAVMNKEDAAVFTLSQNQEQEHEHGLGCERDNPTLPNTPDDGRF